MAGTSNPLYFQWRTPFGSQQNYKTETKGLLVHSGARNPLQKRLPIGPNEAQEALAETHDGICEQHLGTKALAKKVLRAGYFWPTMLKDAKDYVTICDKYQRHANMNIAPPAELTLVTSPWPFAWWGIDLLAPFPKATGQLKYLVVAVDYSTKWIKVEPLAKITAKNVLCFFKRNILARFGIPTLVVSDDGTQFTNRMFQDYVRNLGIKQNFAFVEHPQANGVAEAANRVIMHEIRRRLDQVKTSWAEELHKVLWAYRTTPHSTTDESPFRLTYGTEAVIQIEMNKLSWQTSADTDFDTNAVNQCKEIPLKQKIAAQHNKKVIKREFEIGDLVQRRNQKDSEERKLIANWEGPYRIAMKSGTGAYDLEDLIKGAIPRTWNIEKLKMYYT